MNIANAKQASKNELDTSVPVSYAADYCVIDHELLEQLTDVAFGDPGP